MTHILTTIHADGSKTVSDSPKSPALDALQKAVGGYIETVPLFTRYEGRPCAAYCNEDGKVNGLPANKAATALWAAQPQTKGQPLGDFLVGDVVIVQTKPKG